MTLPESVLKVREFWILKGAENITQEVLVHEPSRHTISDFDHVVEYAAFKAAMSELSALKNPSDGRCMEIGGLRIRNQELQAEVTRLKSELSQSKAEHFDSGTKWGVEQMQPEIQRLKFDIDSYQRAAKISQDAFNSHIDKVEKKLQTAVEALKVIAKDNYGKSMQFKASITLAKLGETGDGK